MVNYVAKRGGVGMHRIYQPNQHIRNHLLIIYGSEEGWWLIELESNNFEVIW